MTPLLETHLRVDYTGKPGVLRDLMIRVDPGEILGLVGQSGSGKSTLSLAILRLLDRKNAVIHGEVRFAGRDLLALHEREMRRVRGREIGLVLQSPLAALNPALRIGTQLKEAWRCHERGGAEGDRRIEETLESVNLPADDAFQRKFPRELSVGLAQRVLIAMAILHRPRLLIADEPTSALDVITQAEILALFSRLSRELGMAILFISHDLPAVASLCDQVAILHDGEIVEQSSPDAIFGRPRHPYTRRLVFAIPAPLHAG
jgi:ABC-type dipeptide/oligopeptide/nickel transport system ATPase component